MKKSNKMNQELQQNLGNIIAKDEETTNFQLHLRTLEAIEY